MTLPLLLALTACLPDCLSSKEQPEIQTEETIQQPESDAFDNTEAHQLTKLCGGKSYQITQDWISTDQNSGRLSRSRVRFHYDAENTRFDYYTETFDRSWEYPGTNSMAEIIEQDYGNVVMNQHYEDTAPLGSLDDYRETNSINPSKTPVTSNVDMDSSINRTRNVIHETKEKIKKSPKSLSNLPQEISKASRGEQIKREQLDSLWPSRLSEILAEYNAKYNLNRPSLMEIECSQ